MSSGKIKERIWEKVDGQSSYQTFLRLNQLFIFINLSRITLDNNVAHCIDKRTLYTKTFYNLQAKTNTLKVVTYFTGTKISRF